MWRSKVGESGKIIIFHFDTTAKYGFANVVTMSGKIRIASAKDFPTHSSRSSVRRQLTVGKSIANTTLTALANPTIISNAL